MNLGRHRVGKEVGRGFVEWHRPNPIVSLPPILTVLNPDARIKAVLQARAEHGQAARQERKDRHVIRAQVRRVQIDRTVKDALTLAQWQQIKRVYAYRCAYCLLVKPLTMDHIIPISKHGTHTRFNVIPACKSCNSRKGNRPASQYHPLLLLLPT